METNTATQSISASTIRSRRLRERRARGVTMTTNLEVFSGGVDILVANALLNPNETEDRGAVAAALSEALERWANGHGAKMRPQLN